MQTAVTDSPTLLRAPPFPWVEEPIRRAAMPGIATPGADIVSIVAAIRAARIGGAFWAEALDASARIVLRPSRDTLAQCLEAGADGGAIAVLDAPDPTLETAIDAAGISLHVGLVDPWSLLAPGVTLIAGREDEWALLARIAGADPVGHDPDALDARLARALLLEVSYRDPFTGQPCDVTRAIEILAEWRRASDRTVGIVAAAGIAWWKRQAIERFLWLGRAALPAVAKDADEAISAASANKGSIAVWPSRTPEGLTDRAADAAIPIVAVEDGFIRSVGLGAGLHPPSSIIVDTRGIYYDPRRPSDLEHFLETADMPPALLARAARLRETILAYGISKYASDATIPDAPRRSDRRIVLVAGQVEDDQSVLTGGAGIAGNFDLLRRARAQESDAYILFKPHPDVDAGHRAGRVPDAEMLAYADEIVRGESMAALLRQVDAVHVLTSLTGFEALLRGLEVTTHGQPFYAGWGLTRDLAGAISRRTRRLTLDQLVAGALLLYPLYLDPETQLPCPAEVLLERFRHQRKPRPTPLTLLRALQGRLAKLFGTTTD